MDIDAFTTYKVRQSKPGHPASSHTPHEKCVQDEKHMKELEKELFQQAELPVWCEFGGGILSTR